LPEGFTLPQAVTLPNNFVTVFHALTADLHIETPWPKPENYVPSNSNDPILIWGGSSSVGQFAIQILRYYGYMNLLTTASHKNHEQLLALGAREAFDYRDINIYRKILAAGGSNGIKRIFDCIGSKNGSIAPIAKIAMAGSTVAILLPVIIRDSTETENPEYEMDVKAVADWQEGADVRGVRTHFYLNVSDGHLGATTLLTLVRMSFSSIIFSPISCPRCSRRASSRRRNRGSSKAKICSSAPKRPWTC
jgi:hypothetical protein